MVDVCLRLPSELLELDVMAGVLTGRCFWHGPCMQHGWCVSPVLPRRSFWSLMLWSEDDAQDDQHLSQVACVGVDHQLMCRGQTTCPSGQASEFTCSSLVCTHTLQKH
jgi:hypothetical protein